MGLLTESLTCDILAIIISIFVLAITFFKWRFQYWQRRGLKTLAPSIPFGDTKDLFLGKASFGDQYKIIYEKFKSQGLKHGGFYMGPSPFYMPIDLEVIKNIMQKDFQHFVNRGIYIDEENDPLSADLFNLEDARWKNLRVKLTPTFTSGKMKMMFETLLQCTVGLKTIMDETVAEKTPVDIKDILGRFTTDIIGSVAFGIECNSLQDPNALFRKYGRRIFEDTPWERLKIVIQFILPPSLLKLTRFKLTKLDVEEFFMSVVKKNVEYREKNNIYRKDFMHLLLQLKNRGELTDDKNIIADSKKSEEKGLTINEVSAQAYVFFAAGFETSSTTMTFALYELATNPHIQDKLREEIITVLDRHQNKLSYDAIMEMTYMDKVFNETLRKYPPLPMLPRQCTKDYPVPNTDIVIEKGVKVVIPVLGIQNDPEYYPNPSTFDPERFSEENKSKRHPFAWLPFGEGPRVCIGLRFGLMQSKVGLATVLKNYRVRLNPKTKLPLEFDKDAFFMSVQGGVWLDVEKLD